LMLESELKNNSNCIASPLFVDLCQ